MVEEQKIGHCLVIIVDTNPFWWGQSSTTDLTITECCNNVMAFANMHLLMGQNNKVAIIAAHMNESKFLYPKPGVTLTTATSDPGSSSLTTQDGKYEALTVMNNTVSDALKRLMLETELKDCSSDTLLAGSLCKALCYTRRLEQSCSYNEKLNSRILVVKGSEDNPSQYMNFMNAVFTAQKQNIPIDVCILDHPSSLLQQACDITGGIYLKIPQLSALLQYLIWLFLPDVETRKKLNLPPQKQVDYRTACFCHRNLIDIGYVCSVCLSIFCAFSPICSTCHTTFKILGPKKLIKKKKRT